MAASAAASSDFHSRKPSAHQVEVLDLVTRLNGERGRADVLDDPRTGLPIVVPVPQPAPVAS